MVDTQMSEGIGRGLGYGPARGAFRLPGRRVGRETGWWDRDFDDGKPKNPWKKVEASGSKVAMGNVEDWPTVGRGGARSTVGSGGAGSASGDLELEGRQQKAAVERKERKPGVLHLPLRSFESATVAEGKPYSYSEALKKETVVSGSSCVLVMLVCVGLCSSLCVSLIGLL